MGSDPYADAGPPMPERRDQVADQRDRAGDRRDHFADERDRTRDQRDLTAGERDRIDDERDRTADERDRAADERDETSNRRDLVADARDRAAEQRDRVAEQRDRAADRASADDGTDAFDRLAVERHLAAADRTESSQDRAAGASERSRAEFDRGTASADRGAGAGGRAQAALDRGTASADREASSKERTSAAVDGLTGIYLRDAGLAELEREMARARRTKQPLVAAFLDVDHLKAINDSRGHASGDRMLLEVANTLKAHLRSYDLIVRYGGDEFVCALPGVTLAEAIARFTLVNEALSAGLEPGSVTIGMAELRATDTPTDLIARADAALYDRRRDTRL